MNVFLLVYTILNLEYEMAQLDFIHPLMNPLLYGVAHIYLITIQISEVIGIWNIQSKTCGLRLEGHTDNVRGCAELSNDKLVSGSDDKTLKFFCTKTGKLRETLKGHSGNIIYCAVFNDDCIVSCSSDNTLKIWNTKIKGKNRHQI